MFGKRGISPVVATVLLIVITVIVASIIVSFVLPFSEDKLGESKDCLNVFNQIEFAETRFSCWEDYENSDPSDDETGFSVHVKSDKVNGYRVALIDDSDGSSDVVDIINGTNYPGNIRDVGDITSYGSSVDFPSPGGIRSYVADNKYSDAEISPILKNGNVCDISDRIEFRHCSSDTVL